MSRYRFYGRNSLHWLLLLAILALAGCSQVTLAQAPVSSPTPTWLSTQEPTQSPTWTTTQEPSPTATVTPSPTSQPTATPVPSLTPTPTITSSPTESIPQARALVKAFCRYGPGQAYLYSYGLYPGDHVEIHGRNASGTWLWVKPDNLERHCWASVTVLEVSGEVKTVIIVQSRLPHSTLYGPPQMIWTDRQGDQVEVFWEPVWMTKDDDRGYLIEAIVCQNGKRIALAVHTDQPEIVFNDENGCKGESSGKLYTVEKHGYTDPVQIPWPSE